MALLTLSGRTGVAGVQQLELVPMVSVTRGLRRRLDEL
jgi:hypothetical protein